MKNSESPDKPSEELSVAPLDIETQEIAKEIIAEDDIDKVKNLTQLFNINTQKRNVIRVLKMNKLLDKVTDEMLDRFNALPSTFSNDDLVKYLKTVEESIDKATNKVTSVEDASAIQLTQNNQVNINIENNLDAEQRKRVLDAVSKILENNIDITTINDENEVATND